MEGFTEKKELLGRSSRADAGDRGPDLASSPSAQSSAAEQELTGTAPTASWNASELESRLTASIAERTRGRLQGLQVRVLGERTVLSGMAGSYHTVQIAVACMLETLSELDLDPPEQIDLNIEVVSQHAAPSRGQPLR